MTTKADYQALISKIEIIENANGKAYLADECVDRENVLVDGRTEQDENFWAMMYGAAMDSAQMRADDLGIDLNI